MADNTCPRCRQKLPDTIDADMAFWYDEQYRQKMDGLEPFLRQYRDALNGLYRIMDENQHMDFETSLSDAYKDRPSLFVKRGRRNVDYIRDKIKKPEEIMAPTDLERDLEELNDPAIRISGKTREDNDVPDHLDTRMQQVTEMVWRTMPLQYQGEIAAYKAVSEDHQSRAEAERNRLQALGTGLRQIKAYLRQLNAHALNMAPAMEAIDREPDASGIRDVRFREKEGTRYACEPVRDDGSAAAPKKIWPARSRAWFPARTPGTRTSVHRCRRASRPTLAQGVRNIVCSPCRKRGRCPTPVSICRTSWNRWRGASGTV